MDADGTVSEGGETQVAFSGKGTGCVLGYTLEPVAVERQEISRHGQREKLSCDADPTGSPQEALELRYSLKITGVGWRGPGPASLARGGLS